MDKVDVTVIIPTCIGSGELRRTIDSLARQTFSREKFEIIVVENGPPGKAKRITEDFENEMEELYYVHEPIPGLVAGRHKGASLARGDLLVFIDDDVMADDGWLNAIAETFEDPEVDIVGGRNAPLYESEPPEWIEAFWTRGPGGSNWCGYLALLDFGDTYREIDPSFVWGLNFSIRKKTFTSLGGFHPDAVPWELRRFRGDGETALCLEAQGRGLKALYQPDALVHHVIPKKRMTVEYFEKRSYLQGISDSYTRIRKYWGIETSLKKNDRKLSLQRFKNIFMHLWHLGSPDPHLEIKEKVRVAYQRGYEFHQKEVKNDPKLLEWVLRKDYWDYHLPTT